MRTALDLSSLLAWAMPFVAGAAAVAFGRSLRRKDDRPTAVACIGYAVGVGLVFTFAQLMAYAGCQHLGLCKYVGDEGASYVYQSLLGAPVYWLLLLGTSREGASSQRRRPRS